MRMRSLTCIVAFCLLSVSCDQGNPNRPSPIPTTPQPPTDFVGRVLTPIRATTRSQDNTRPVQGATVTITGGSRAGERVSSDGMGKYLIPEFDGEEILLRVEASGFELKEVVVSRTRPTTLTDRMPLGYLRGPQENPGTILIGLKWPSVIKDIIQRSPVVPDLLMLQEPAGPLNYYDSGLIQVISLDYLKVMAHEVCHAHQHYRVDPRAPMVTPDPDGTPPRKVGPTP